MNCPYCATELPEGAMFCGECGRAVVTPATVPSLALVCEQCGSSMNDDDIFCGECGFVARSVRASEPRPRDTNVVERLEPAEERAGEPAIEPVVEPVVEHETPSEVLDDIEPTRIVARHQGGERFILQFSTGESFTVHGTGLVGRSPNAEPGEYFDQLIRVQDPGRSVSKTHLEFGQEAGSFWVKDRFSGNGTVVREPDAGPVRCHPDRRYRLVRGSRVELGEQFFIVS